MTYVHDCERKAKINPDENMVMHIPDEVMKDLNACGYLVEKLPSMQFFLFSVHKITQPSPTSRRAKRLTTYCN